MQNNVDQPQTMRGSCLCGAITYKVLKIEPAMGHCHCSMCRKFHGSAFATFGEALIENFSWQSGEDLLQSYSAENGSVRQFCGVCGSSLTFAPSADSDKCVEFALGTLDSTIAQRPDAHIFTEYKADWFDVLDELPKFKESRE